MSHQQLSVFITTYNNGSTLRRCIESVGFADEVVVLDSFSTDETVELARSLGCRVEQQAFAGYGPQKQAALEMTTHRWVLLLDADEALTESAQQRIANLLSSEPDAAGYRLPRIEQMFWRMQSRKSRLNDYLRLFDKTRGRISKMPVHAAPEVDGPVRFLDAPFHHYGEADIHTKVAKINGYSSGLVRDKVARGVRGARLRMVFYPGFFFLKTYLGKRQFVNGWAGFIASVIGAGYVFLKYAKLYEHRRRAELGLPPIDHPLS
ncbi:MAG: glycosyltransferase family 2 protein [Xanthomonadales bacterium]|nr:glycosyltransferase family 2 protein [Xanthomonadales bacterium]